MRHFAFVVAIIALVSFVVTVMAQPPVSPPTVKGKAAQRQDSDPCQLRVSTDQKWAIYVFRRRGLEPLRCDLLDLTSGKVVDLTKLAPHAWDGEFSDDSKRAWFSADVTAGVGTVYVIDLDTLKRRKVIESTWIIPQWLGNRLAVTLGARDGKTGPIQVIDLDSGTTVDSKISGVMLGADSAGAWRVAKALPSKLSTPWSIIDTSDLAKTADMLFDSRWQKVRELAGHVSVPAFSPSGKYMACRSWRSGEKPFTIVESPEGKNSWRIENPTIPIAVTDDGGVLALGEIGENEGKLLFWAKGKQSPALLEEGVAAAALVGENVYFIPFAKAGKGDRTIKSVKLPKSPSTTSNSSDN